MPFKVMKKLKTFFLKAYYLGGLMLAVMAGGIALFIILVLSITDCLGENIERIADKILKWMEHSWVLKVLCMIPGMREEWNKKL